MSEYPPFLFVLTSTALVLGAIIPVRGLLGVRPVAQDAALPAVVFGDDAGEALLAQATAVTAATEPASPTDFAPTGPGSPADVAPAAMPRPAVRDLREPIVMTIVGVLICTFTLLGISALVNNA
ncbi:MAG: hypothetical protein LH650_06725 [Chloroflexi bacterium]|nr:hypothetical protein [Chloroflexota bacterium]